MNEEIMILTRALDMKTCDLNLSGVGNNIGLVSEINDLKRHIENIEEEKEALTDKVSELQNDQEPLKRQKEELEIIRDSNNDELIRLERENKEITDQYQEVT
jgi:chromosome segregation ATPase